jgi:hypothetical protein
MGFPQTWVLSMWPLSKIKRAYISWWIYQTTKCNVINRWFSLGTPASSTTKTGLHEIAEILLKVALNTKNPNQSIKSIRCTFCEISIEFYSTSTDMQTNNGVSTNMGIVYVTPVQNKAGIHFMVNLSDHEVQCQRHIMYIVLETCSLLR